MFCPKCGTELPDGTKFCNHCGAEQGGTATQTQTQTQAQTQTQTQAQNSASPAEKKKPNKILLSLAIIVVAGLFGRLVIAPMLVSDSTSGGSGAQNPGVNVQMTGGGAGVTPVTNSSPSASSEYEEIFDSRYIVESPALFFGLDTASYAKVDSDGMIEKYELGYKDDVVEQMVCTVYLPISDLSDEQKSALDVSIKEEYSQYTSDGFCSAKYNMGNNYYTVTLDFTELDNMDNVKKLGEYGFVENGAELISQSKTETDLISNGFVKK